MPTVQTHPGNNASTFLTHLFGQGLDDDRYRVERFRSMADGDIRPLRAKEAKKGRSKTHRGRLCPGRRSGRCGPSVTRSSLQPESTSGTPGSSTGAAMFSGGTCCSAEWRSLSRRLAGPSPAGRPSSRFQPRWEDVDVPLQGS